MADGGRSRERYGESFWRAHHASWRESDLNQREYCKAEGDFAQGVRQLPGEVGGGSARRTNAHIVEEVGCSSQSKQRA